jgi:hypothetical protein
MIVANFINQMNWHKVVKTAVLSKLRKATKLELFDLYSTDIELELIKKTAVSVMKELYNKNHRDISRLYGTYTPHKTILTLFDQNEKAYQNELKRINEVK